MNVIIVANPLPLEGISMHIREYIQERNLTNVMSAANALPCGDSTINM